MIDFDKMIEDSVKALVDGNPKEAAESLVEIATLMHKAGYQLRGFVSVRDHIVAEATRQSDSAFIDDRLKMAEKELQRSRAFH